MMVALYRLRLVLQKHNFNPNQPRVPAGNHRLSGEWGDGSGRTSATIGATQIAASGQPLKARAGNGRAAQVARIANSVADPNTRSFSLTVGTGAESTSLKVVKQAQGRVTL